MRRILKEIEMKKLLIVLVLICGCIDNSGDGIPDKLSGTWDVTQIFEDGTPVVFSVGTITMNKNLHYDLDITGYKGTDMFVSGKWNYMKVYFYVNVEYTDNTNFMDYGTKAYEYTATDTTLYYKFTSPVGTIIEIYADRI